MVRCIQPYMFNLDGGSGPERPPHHMPGVSDRGRLVCGGVQPGNFATSSGGITRGKQLRLCDGL